MKKIFNAILAERLKYIWRTRHVLGYKFTQADDDGKVPNIYIHAKITEQGFAMSRYNYWDAIKDEMGVHFTLQFKPSSIKEALLLEAVGVPIKFKLVDVPDSNEIDAMRLSAKGKYITISISKYNKYALLIKFINRHMNNLDKNQPVNGELIRDFLQLCHMCKMSPDYIVNKLSVY